MVSLKRGMVALSVVYLTLTSIVVHADAGAGAAPGAGGSNIYCSTAFDKFLCQKLTKTATNWNQAMSMGLTEAMKHVDLVIRKSKSESLGDSRCGETYVNIQSRYV